jgi:integrase
MSLYKQPDSEIWWASISVPGHRRLRESTGEHDRQKAQKRHDELLVERRNESPALRGDTWGKAVEKWLDREDRSDSELLSLRKFGLHFADRALVKVTPDAIDQALTFCKSAGTYTRYRTMIAAILNLSDTKLKLVSRKDKKTKPRDWITHEQWAKLRPELPPHMRAMAEFAISTGLRQANVLGLTWDRVDLERKLVWVEAEDTKANQALAVPLSEDALAVLKTKLAENEAAALEQVTARILGRKNQCDQYVFTYRGKPIKEIKTAFHAACLRAKVGKHDADGHYTGFTWHGFRHTWATWHVQNGTPLEVLQKLGGWSDLRMVMNYSHHSPGHLAGYADNSGRRT